MPGVSEGGSPGLRSGSLITTSPAGNPSSYSPIIPGDKNSDRIVRGVMLECGPMRLEVPDVVSDDQFSGCSTCCSFVHLITSP
jgi:hypothetical protein